MTKFSRICELCNHQASLYCPSDSAFLCSRCDAKVHNANFLVARHLRFPICSKCEQFTHHRFSGVHFHPCRRICLSCSAHDLHSLPSSSSSACLSTAESSASPPPGKELDFDRRVASSSSLTDVSSDFPSGEAKQTEIQRSRRSTSVDARAEGVLVNWGRRLGLGAGAVAVAVRGLSQSISEEGELRRLPSRVSLAAALWLSLRVGGGRRSGATWQMLKRLVEISGVPAKLIVTWEAKMTRVLRSRTTRGQREAELEEGWAENST